MYRQIRTIANTWRVQPRRCAVFTTRSRTFPVRSRPFGQLIETKCHALLQNKVAMSALPAADRDFLLMAYSRLMTALDALSFKRVPIHGDAGPHNVFMAAEGAIYADFAQVTLGPREWDIGFLPESELTAFGVIDRELLSVLSDLRSLCVAVWCWGKYDMPEKREAADYHLEYLKERYR
jgi:hypothetical protein